MPRLESMYSQASAARKTASMAAGDRWGTLSGRRGRLGKRAWTPSMAMIVVTRMSQRRVRRPCRRGRLAAAARTGWSMVFSEGVAGAID